MSHKDVRGGRATKTGGAGGTPIRLSAARRRAKGAGAASPPPDAVRRAAEGAVKPAPDGAVKPAPERAVNKPAPEGAVNGAAPRRAARKAAGGEANPQAAELRRAPARGTSGSRARASHPAKPSAATPKPSAATPKAAASKDKPAPPAPADLELLETADLVARAVPPPMPDPEDDGGPPGPRAVPPPVARRRPTLLDKLARPFALAFGVGGLVALVVMIAIGGPGRR